MKQIKVVQTFTTSKTNEQFGKIQHKWTTSSHSEVTVLARMREKYLTQKEENVSMGCIFSLFFIDRFTNKIGCVCILQLHIN